MDGARSKRKREEGMVVVTILNACLGVVLCGKHMRLSLSLPTLSLPFSRDY